jgi:hypothetical protein
VIDLTPKAPMRRSSGPSGPTSSRRSLRLVWSQPSRPGEERPRRLLGLSVACLFSGGLLMGTNGMSRAPAFIRIPVAALTGVGALSLILSGALLALEKGRRVRDGRPSAAELPPASERFRQEERR